MKKNNKENKIILFTTLGIIGTIIIILGVTYAYWRLTKEQTGVNIVNSACLNVTMENQANDINLENAYPIVDSDGLKLEPFTFTLKNNCEEYADYTISLEMLSVTDLNSDFVKVALNEEGISASPKILGSYDEYEDLKLQDTIEGRTITSGKLEPNSEKNYELRIWLDGDVTVDDDAMNKIYKSKVVIESTIGEEPKKLSEEICNGKEESGACYIAKKADIESEEPALMYDDTEDGNLRYVGANPNNYIKIASNMYDRDIYVYNFDYVIGDLRYNSMDECENEWQDYIQEGKGTCELLHKQGEPILWQIIGVMKNVTVLDNNEEKQEDLIKIIRADSIGNYSWDTSEDGVNGGDGVNEWSQADIMKLLNPSYGDNRDSICVEENDFGECINYSENQLINNSLYWNNESGQCYSGQSDANKPCDFTSSGISEEARGKIAKVRWNTGTFATDDGYETEWTASATYEAERSEINGKNCKNDEWNLCTDEVDRTTTWDGYIGLMNPSDFGYAVGKNVRETCLAKSMYNYDDEGCYEANWLSTNNYDYFKFTINPISNSSKASMVFGIEFNNGLDISRGTASNSQPIQPVAFLKSSVTITDGIGTKENPFVAS